MVSWEGIWGLRDCHCKEPCFCSLAVTTGVRAAALWSRFTWGRCLVLMISLWSTDLGKGVGTYPQHLLDENTEAQNG